MNQKIPDNLLQPTWAEEQKKQHKSVQEYTLMDDIFMSTVLSDSLACQHMLRIILQEPELIVREGKRIMKSLSQQIYEEGQSFGKEQIKREVICRMAAQGIAISVIAKSVNVAESIFENWLTEAASTQK